jgi:hypothetical protein
VVEGVGGVQGVQCVQGAQGTEGAHLLGKRYQRPTTRACLRGPCEHDEPTRVRVGALFFYSRTSILAHDRPDIVPIPCEVSKADHTSVFARSVRTR